MRSLYLLLFSFTFFTVNNLSPDNEITLYGNLDIDQLTQTWAVNKAFDTGEIDLGLDLPVAIKGMESAPLNTYTYIYNKPGTYTATFRATNSTVDESEKVIREVKITVTE